MRHIPSLLVLTALCITLSATVTAQSLPGAAPEAVGMSSSRLARIAAVLKEDIDEGRLPGAVVAIARKDKLVYFEAFGFLDKPAGVPMPKDGIFRIASMTKPLATVGALMLYEENKLLVNDPVGKYLPPLGRMSVAVMDPSGKTVTRTEPARRQPTLQDLMRHTSGFSYGNRGNNELHKKYPQGSADTADIMTGPQFIGALNALPLHYQPGTTWQYGLGFDVLGLVVEATARQPLGAFLSERLFRPLGMADTAFVLSAEQAKRFAKALPPDPDTGAAQVNRDPTVAYKFECGGACAFSTATDCLRFAQMLLNRGQLAGTRVPGPKAVDYMTADQLGPEVNVAALRD